MRLVTNIIVYHVPLILHYLLSMIHDLTVQSLVFIIKYLPFAVCFVLCTIHVSLFATLYYVLCTYYVLQPFYTQLPLFRNCYSEIDIHFWIFTIGYLLLTMYCPLFTINHGLCHIYCCFPIFTLYYICDSRGCSDDTTCEHHGNIMWSSKFRRRSRRSSPNGHGMQLLVVGQPIAIADTWEPYIYDV